MAIASKKMYWGAPPLAVETTLYTVPGSATAEVKEIWLCNVTANTATVSLSIVNSGAAAVASNRIMQAKSVPANEIIIIACTEHMDPGDFISGLQATAGAINVRISGIEVS